MALKNLFDMVKVDRYTADGREALIKAQEAETEDKVYQIGEISQKTGLQKTANGWVKPKSGKQPGAKKEDYKPSRRVDPKKQPQVSNPNVLGMTSSGAKKRFEALGGEFLENKDGVDIFKTRDGDLVEVHYDDNNKVLRTQTTPAEVATSKPTEDPKTSVPTQGSDWMSLPSGTRMTFEGAKEKMAKNNERIETIKKMMEGKSRADNFRLGSELKSLQNENEYIVERLPPEKTESQTATSSLPEQSPEEIREIGRAAREWREGQKRDARERQAEVQKALAEQMKKEANSSDIKIRGMDKNQYIFNTMMERHIPKEKAEESWNQEVERVNRLRAESNDAAPRQLTGDTRIRVRKA